MTRYDVAAPCFERQRALPHGVPETIRAAVLRAIGPSPPRPRLLDLGAGTGRIGRSFVTAGDDYVGVDLSIGMLREFQRRGSEHGTPRLVQADGTLLPFADETFDAVLLVQVFGAMDDWRTFLSEVRRVLRSGGRVMTGRILMPVDGVDAQMKQRLAAVLAEMEVQHRAGVRDEAERCLESSALSCIREVAASWTAERTPRDFLERHRKGARFSVLPGAVKDEALDRLARWATKTFGSLDVAAREPHSFELRVYCFAGVER
jgi:ubiquinone/menaquinone biosynthesis C-methylase UbiE